MFFKKKKKKSNHGLHLSASSSVYFCNLRTVTSYSNQTTKNPVFPVLHIFFSCELTFQGKPLRINSIVNISLTVSSKVITAHLVWALLILFLYRSHAFVFSLLKKTHNTEQTGMLFQMQRIPIQFPLVRAVKTFQVLTDLCHHQYSI